MKVYLVLAIAIVAEVIGTSALKASDGFTRLVPICLVAVAYGISFYCLSLALRAMPVGIAYAVWSGVGIVLVSGIGWIVYGQTLDAMALLGLSFIIAGVLIVNLLSNSASH